MKGKPKTRKVAGFMRAVLAQNVRSLLERDFKDLPNLTARQRKLAKDAGVSFSTVQRIMAEDVGASLDNVESIAEVFQVSVYQLMLPALDIGNPQVVNGATESEKKFYRIWKRTKLGERESATEQ